jgi:putative aldouronate transport system permease protein
VWPEKSTLSNYTRLLKDKSLGRAFVISVLKTVIGVVTHTFFCAMVAYGMSKPYLLNRKVYTVMGIVTMYFSGGMIPTYLLMKALGMLNSFSVYIIPALLSYFDVIVLLNFFRTVPQSLEESAKIDGASDFRTFMAIYLPISKPALATIALFNGVGQWNDFMTARLYITNELLYPLQMKLYQIIVRSQLAQNLSVNAAIEINTTTKGVQLAMIVVSTVPILIIYPLLQKYFVTGMTLGAVKE